jgi:hypothetical protein
MKRIFSLILVSTSLFAFSQDKVNFDSPLLEVYRISSEMVAQALAEQLPTSLATEKNLLAPTVNYDISCDGTTFVLGVSEPPDVIYAGQTFLVYGYVYPEGTFAANDLNGGALPEGGPQWPDLVIGEWLCRGFVGVDTAVTLQYFGFENGDKISTDGRENAGLDPANRNVVGGSGGYTLIRGEVDQDVVGVNPSMAPNFTMVFQLRPRIDFKQE